MIPKPIASIAAAEIDALFASQIPEGRTLEYKRDLPGNTDADKREFLADVSSFANTAGGDLIFGIQESGGIPTGIHGIGAVDLDAEQMRIDSIVLAGIEPRVRFRLHLITASNGERVLLLRVEQSWEAPHRVVFKQHDRFYARSSAGKYALDTGELRQAFARGAGLAESIARFRDERLISISAGRAPIALDGPGALVLHLIPLEAIASTPRHTVATLTSVQGDLRPISSNGWSNRITLNGFMTYTRAGATALSYTHLYRNGTIEAVDAYIVNRVHNGVRHLPSIAFEKRLIESTHQYLTAQQKLGIAPPIFCCLSFVGARGLTLGLSAHFLDLGDRTPLVDDIVAIPEAVLASYGESTSQFLRGPIDMVWNAFGFDASPNFNDAGVWQARE